MHRSYLRNITRLRRHGLDIRTTEDIGPYKKIIPALLAFPEAIIVTADDDIFYEAIGSKRSFTVGMAKPTGSYATVHTVSHWIIAACRDRTASGFLMSVNRENPPICLQRLVAAPYSAGIASCRRDRQNQVFIALPERRRSLALLDEQEAGAVYKLVQTPKGLVNWPGSQKVSLYSHNRGPSGNDEKIRTP